MKLQNLIGMRFGRLLVQKRVESQGKVHWACTCDCGTEVTVESYSLKTGSTKSCGCYRVEVTSKRTRLRPYEALYRTFLHSAKKRYPVDLSYEQFLEFTNQRECHYCGKPIEWAEYLGEANNRQYNLDRKDNSLEYTVNNCVACCSRCNRAKNDHFTYEEWVTLGNVIRTWPQ